MPIPLARPGVCRFFQKCFRCALAGFALTALFLVSSSIPAQAANILIVAGTNGIAQTAAGVLDTELTTAGNTVTSVNTAVPASLVGFTQIYDLRYNNSPAFTAGEMAQYLAFLNAAAGNTIFLMGENVAFNARNTPINQFIALAGGGTIAAPAITSANSETVTPPFTGPNVIATVKFAACGLVTTAGTGAFASSEAGGGCSIFFNQQRLLNAPTGALIVVYDVNFIATTPTGGAVNEVAFRQNLEQFASAPPVGAPPTVVTGISPINGPSPGGTVVTITGVNFTGATAVNFGGVAASFFTVNSDTSITAVSPSELAGTVDVRVTAPGGISPIGPADRFSFTVVLTVPTPTLGEWAMIALALLLGGTGYLGLLKSARRDAAV